MKIIFVSMLFVLILACATKLPVFDKKIDCSEEALNVVNPKKEKIIKKNPKDAIVEVSQLMNSLTPLIRKCYQKSYTNKLRRYNVCYIGIYNKNRELEFSNFSAKRTPMSKTFKTCLEKVSRNKFLKDAKLNNVKIIQPFRLYPKK